MRRKQILENKLLYLKEKGKDFYTIYIKEIKTISLKKNVKKEFCINR